jgi:hypothetical protein
MILLIRWLYHRYQARKQGTRTEFTLTPNRKETR